MKKRRITKLDGDVLANQTAAAKWIADTFKDKSVTCLRQTIQRWQTEWDPGFPPAKQDGSYRKSEARQWVESVFLAHRVVNNGAPSTAGLQQQADEAKLRGQIEREKHEEWAREEKAPFR